MEKLSKTYCLLIPLNGYWRSYKSLILILPTILARKMFY